MVQITQFLHMQRVPFHFLSNVLNSEIFSVVLTPLLIEFHNLAPSYIEHFCHEYSHYNLAALILRVPIIIRSTFLREHTMSISRT